MSKEFKLKEWGTDVPYGIKTPTNVDEFRQTLSNTIVFIKRIWM